MHKLISGNGLWVRACIEIEFRLSAAAPAALLLPTFSLFRSLN